MKWCYLQGHHAKRINPLLQRQISCFSLICGPQSGKLHERKRRNNYECRKGKGREGERGKKG
jgi:hypothetical protein